MPCIVGKNKITCIRLSANQQSRIKSIYDGQIYWSHLPKCIYDAMPENSIIPLGEKMFIKSKTEYMETRQEWLDRMANE